SHPSGAPDHRLRRALRRRYRSGRAGCIPRSGVSRGHAPCGGGTSMTNAGRALLILVLLLAPWPAGLTAQGRGGPPQPPPTGRAGAHSDLTGAWVPIITEDWRFRMVTPPRGDYGGVPPSAEGRRVAAAWDSAGDTGP